MPLRVALLATTVEFGGIEKVVLSLLRHMRGDVELLPVVFTRSDGGDGTFLERLREMPVEPRTLYVDRSRLKYMNPVRNIVEAAAVLRSERFDLIHSHGYRADVIALALSWWFRRPVVSTCHGFTPNTVQLALYSRLNLFLLRRFHQVMAVSVRMRDDLCALGLKPDRVAVVTNAVEAAREESAAATATLRDRFGIGPDELVIGFVGRLSEEKGVADLVEAVGRRAPTAGPWRVVLVGEGPEREQLAERVARLGLANRITFVGFEKETSPWYSIMDVFALPSLTEGTPMALLEAMAHGVPVVATEVGGVPAIVTDRVSGVLVPPSDPDALSEALCEVAGSPELRGRLSAAGLEVVRTRFDVGTWTASVRRVYERAMEIGRS